MLLGVALLLGLAGLIGGVGIVLPRIEKTTKAKVAKMAATAKKRK